MRRLGVPWGVVGICVLWLGALTASFFVLLRYKNTPVLERAAPATWPAGSVMDHDRHRPTLLMFAHPRCGCTRASIGELAVLMASSQGLVSAHVFLYRPRSGAPDWAHGEIFDSAAAIPGVTVHEDEDGRQARLFLSQASGHTLLYGAQGELLFDGGITASRGHAGDSAGRDALTALIHNRPAAQTRTAVFGCLIHSDELNETKADCGDRPCMR